MRRNFHRQPEKVVTVDTPIQDQANVSSDGGMILLRKEGWKEVKMCVFSQVKVLEVPPTSQESRPAPKITLQKHSYQVGLWDADEMGQHQYLEGTRRQVALCPRFGSVNDVRSGLTGSRLPTSRGRSKSSIGDMPVNVYGKSPKLLLEKEQLSQRPGRNNRKNNYGMGASVK